MAKRQLTYDDLAVAFSNKNFAPYYLFYGAEQFFVDRLQKMLLSNALESHERDFNQDIIYGTEADARSILSVCVSFPLMATRRVVVIRDFDKVKENQLFTAYAENPNPSAVVLFVCSGKINAGSNPYRALKKHGVSAEFKPLYDRQMPRWINRLAKEMGFEMESRATQMLADFMGNELQATSAELGKLATYIGNRKKVTADDVVHASGQTRDFNVFELQRALGEMRQNDTVRITERLLQQSSNSKGESTMIVAVLTSYFIKLWQLSEFQKLRISEKEMAAGIGVSPFFIKEYLSTLRRYDDNAIKKAFSSLLAADYELKGGSSRSERLVLNLMFRKIFESDTAIQVAA